MSEAGLQRDVDPARFAEEPETMLWMAVSDQLAMDPAEVEKIQLAAIRNRLAELRGKIAVLGKLADEQGIDDVASINEAAPLLFKHSIYKSYPVSLIERNRFDRLTNWLQGLTTIDLSGFDAEGIDSIDGWLDALLEQKGLRIIHSTGTSGKLSFLPRGAFERSNQLRCGRLTLSGSEGPEPTGLDTMPMIVMGHRYMFNGYGASLEAMIGDLYKGDESMAYTLYPGRMSADLLSLAGRLASAEARGDLGREQIPASLLARRDQFVAEQKDAPALRRAFFRRVLSELKGRPVLMTGNWIMFYDLMTAAREDGVADGVFHPDSRFVSAGGTKGRTFPDGYQEDIKRFLGVERIAVGYGMSEIMSLMMTCSAGKYHALPTQVCFVLDPETGEPAPRQGTHTGRFGVIDLAIKSHWGGILSGDEVTLTYGKCACGRSGPHIEDTVRRYSEKEGGDDKIVCAGAPEAHDNALDFLAEMG